MAVTPRRQRRERELRKRQRERRGSRAPERRGGGPRGPLIGVGLIVLVIAALFGLNRAGALSVAAPTPPPTPLPTVGPVAPDDPARGTHEPETSKNHVPSGTLVTYATLPPTSGDHWGTPQAPVAGGVKDTLLPFEVTTHNLEHGGIVIVYSGLSTTEADQLKQFVRDTTTKSKFTKVLVEPYPDLKGAKVVATAWTWRLNLDSVDTGALTKFIAAHYDSSDAPEPGAAW